MLDRLGKIVTAKPWLVVGIVLVITIGFSTLLPTLEMQTSMDDFLPDDKVILADERIQEFFGTTNEVVMVLSEGESKESILSASGLKILYQISEDLVDIDDVDSVMSIAGFIDMVCGLEYNKSMDECTSEEILSVYEDLMTTPSTEPQIIHGSDDVNEDVDYQKSRLSRKVSLDTMDVRNLQIQQNDTHIMFTILLFDTTDIESLLLSRGLNVNVVEWFVSFQNIIGPAEMQEMQYRLSARLEPTEELWELGDGMFSNLGHIIQLIRTRNLRNSYIWTPVLWLTPPGSDMSIPMTLETGNISWDTENIGISITVSREELRGFGLGFETAGFGMPARIGNISCGVRCYQLPLLNNHWKRVTLNLNATENLLSFVQNRPLLGRLGERLLSNRAGLNWDDVNELFDTMQDQMSAMDTISLKMMEQLYRETDRAPDSGVMSGTVFLKPSFLEGIKETVINFIASDYTFETGASSVLLMVNINGSTPTSDLEAISKDIVALLGEYNEKQNGIVFEATGNSIIEYEINEISMEANNVIMPMIFVVIIVVLFLSFRKFSYVVLPLLGLTFAIIWMFGTMILLQMPFMVMEIALIPMLMGLGVDYSVHLYHNYRVEKGKGKSAKDAIETSIQEIGVAMLLATITTFIAFLSFLTATMIPLRDFGVLCAVGIAYVFAITLTFQAAMRFILDRRKEQNNKKNNIIEKKQSYGTVMRKIARMVCNHPIPLLVITLCFTVVMAIGATQIQTGFAMEDFLPEENPSVVVMTTILDEYPFASQEKEYILIEQDDLATVSVVEDLYTTIQRCQNDPFVMMNRDGEPKISSILSVMQTAMNENSSLIEEFSLDTRGIPQSDVLVADFFDYLYDHDAYGFEMQSYLHLNEMGSYTATVVHIFTDTYSGDDDDVSSVMGTLYTDLNDDVEGLFDEATVTVTGENSMMHVIMNSMTESQLLSTMICLILAAIVLIIAYRNIALGLITMIPVCFSTIWIIGAMYYIGYNLNVMTIMITSLTIGLGITYAIHAVERFRMSANNTGDVITAVAETIGHTGGALLISAITTMLGFGMLVLTPMPVEQQFGLITAITIAFSFLTSIFLLPPVLLFWGRWRKKHKGYIISKGDPNNKS